MTMSDPYPNDPFVPERVEVEYWVTEMHGTTAVTVATFEVRANAEAWADDHYENVSNDIPEPATPVPDAFVHKVRRFGDTDD